MKNDFIKNKIKSKNGVNQRSQPTSTKKDKNKRIASIILLSLMAFWTICSIFGLSSFLGCNSAPKQVSADSVNLSYEFKGSNLTFQNIFIPYGSFTPNNSTSNFTNTFRFSFTGYNDPAENSYKTEVVFSTGYWEQAFTPMEICYYTEQWNDLSRVILDTEGRYVIQQDTTSNGPTLTYKDIFQDFYLGLQTDILKQRGFFRMHVRYSNQSYFDANVVKVELGNFAINNLEDFTNYWDWYGGFADPIEEIPYGLYYVNFVRYIDNDGDYIEFQMPVRCNQNFKSQFLYDNRTYYLEEALNGSNSDSYLLGFNEGYQDGKKDGIDEGFIKGENYAKDVWFRAGYNKGLSETNPYTFSSLLGSVIDAPITALFGNTVEVNGELVRVDGLLNFELLGVNLSTFLGGILMASLVIAIIKLIL